MSVLGWIGRQKARGIAALVFISILTPPLGAVLKPYVTESVFGLLCVAFLRINLPECKRHLRQPGLILCATFWTSLLVPTVMLIAFSLFGVNDSDPELFLGLALQTVASPMMATPAIAALMGLDATLVLMTLLTSTALVPFTASALLSIAGIELALSPWQFGLKLGGLILGSLVIGMVVRKWLGAAKIVAFESELDGLNILLLFVFISAVMGQLGIRFLNSPLLVIGLTLTTFVLFTILFSSTYLLFLKSGKDRAFSLALMTSQRNMGLMVAATGGLLPDMAWLYFAVSQFPIYFAPLILNPLLPLSREKPTLKN